MTSGQFGETKVHDFHERLAFSEEAGHEDFWQKIYTKAFPDMIFAKLCTGKCQGQFLGIDRVIQLQSGKTLYIDEKKREDNYGDIALEHIANDTTGAPGWIKKDLSIDYLAYAIMPTETVYLMPWEMLRRVWNRFGEEWIEKYFNPVAKNRNYNTISVAIPTDLLLSKLKISMKIVL